MCLEEIEHSLLRKYIVTACRIDIELYRDSAVEQSITQVDDGFHVSLWIQISNDERGRTSSRF